MKRYDRSPEDYDRSIPLNPCLIGSFWGRAQTLYEMKLYSQDLSVFLLHETDFADDDGGEGDG